MLESITLHLHSVPEPELPPPPPRACLGRDELTEEIVNLAEGLEPIALIGEGGIGKTSVALTVLHNKRIKDRFGDNRRFIRCDEFPASCAHLLGRLSEVIGAGIEHPENLAHLRSSLSSKVMILFLDNAESLLDPGGADSQELYSIVEELSRFSNLCLGITSRISTIPPHFKRPIISALSMGSARDIFYSIYDHHGRSDIINDLVRELDFHPLSIELLATTASHNTWDHARLAKEWDAQRTWMLRTDFNQSLAASVEFSLASPTFKNLGQNARDVLEVVAFFPQGVEEKDVDWLFPTIPNGRDVVDKLCTLSLTRRNNGFVTMLAPIRDYFCPRDPRSSPLLCPIKDRYLTRLSSIFVDPCKPGFGEAQWITSEDVNVECLLDAFISFDADGDDVWDACVHFMRHLYWYKPRQTILRSKIEALPDNHRSKPKCLFQLARLFQSVGNRAEQKQVLTHTLRLERGWGDDGQIAQTLRHLSDVNRVLGFHEEGMQQAKEALGVYERLGDVSGQAVCLNNLAWSLLGGKQLNAAEYAASRTIELIRGKKDQEFLACESHRALGDIYHFKGEKNQAIRHFQVAIGIAAPHKWHSQLFWLHYSLAGLFLNTNGFDDAHTYSDQAKVHAGEDVYRLGRVMEMRAKVWYRQRKLEDAEAEVLDALEIFKRLGAARDVSNCTDLLQKIERARRGWSTNLHR